MKMLTTFNSKCSVLNIYLISITVNILVFIQSQRYARLVNGSALATQGDDNKTKNMKLTCLMQTSMQ